MGQAFLWLDEENAVVKFATSYGKMGQIRWAFFL